MGCKLVTVYGAKPDFREPSTIAVPDRDSPCHTSNTKPKCNCYKMKGKHSPEACAGIPDTRNNKKSAFELKKENKQE